MDRKGWIIIIVCLVGLALNQWWGAQRQAEWRSQQAILEAARKADLAANPAAADPAAGPEAAGGVEAPRAELANIPPQPAFSEVETPLVWREENGSQSVRYVFTNRGGGLKRVEFPGDQVHANGGGPVTLNRGAPFAAGALSNGVGIVETGEYQLVESGPARVVFEGSTYSGLRARKEFIIEQAAPRALPLVSLRITLSNPTEAETNAGTWFLYLGSMMPLLADEFAGQTGIAWFDGDRARFKAATAFEGGMFSTAKVLLNGRIENTRWLGTLNQFYAALALPAAAGPRDWWAIPLRLDVPGRRTNEIRERVGIQAAAGLGAGPLAPGASLDLDWKFFFGPKNFDALKRVGGDIHHAMLYSDMPIFGWMAGPFSKLLNWALHRINSLVPNFGIAIVLLTIVIRCCIWPLHAKAQRTMKKMALLNPILQELRTKYPDDPQKMNMEMMKLYKEYGINPLGGCLPVLLQMPIFFGFYRMLQYAAELRHESFLWVADLSQPDTVFHLAGIPVNVLPLLMAGTMVLQMKMTPQTGDPTQRKIFMFMPVIFLFICYNFASALSLYWTTSNIFSIGQTWLMQRRPDVKLEKVQRRQRPSLAELKRRMSGQPANDAKPKNRPPRTGG
jgi:YidC/Oxa1 family membrane protein insertase